VADRVLSTRELNRALLARQLLLEQFARWLAANDFPTLDEAAVGTSTN
jgi:hypothetical protein